MIASSSPGRMIQIMIATMDQGDDDWVTLIAVVASLAATMAAITLLNNQGYALHTEIAAMLAPLTTALLSRATHGQSRPMNYPLSRTVRDQIQARVEAEAGIEMIGAGRNAIDRKRTIGSRDGKIGMLHHEDVRAHPGMNVALEVDGIFGASSFFQRSLSYTAS